MKSRIWLCASLCALLIQTAQGADTTSDTLDDLLSQYRSESDLSRQTKQESAGSLIVYTRERLEKMQAYNLRDILKTIPVFTMQESFTGQVSLAKASGATFNSQFLKLYINDHEVGSIGFGSAMKMWGYLDISYIDHAEIYQVGSSVMAGDEPPGIVVRLYTKDPSRENGGAVQAMGGSRGSYEVGGYYAYKGEDFSTFVYGATHDEDRNDYNSGRSAVPVDRDFDSTNLFASFQKGDFSLEAAQFSLEHDRFLGFGTSRTPLDNRADLLHRYVIANQYFQDRTLKIRLAYDHASHIQNESDPSGIKLFNPDGTLSTYEEWYFDKSEEILDAVIDKRLLLASHDIHLGAQAKHKRVDAHSLLTDGIERIDELSGPDRWNTLSVFFSDDWTLNDYNLIFTNIKYDRYDLNNGGKDFEDYVLRLGHIYNDGTWMWKTFATRTYGYPIYMQTSYFPFVYKSDVNLKNEERMAASTEVSYMTPSSTTNLRILYNTARNAIVLQQNVHLNTDEKPNFYALSASHEYRFTPSHEIHLSAYYGDDDMPMTQSSKAGALVQLFNTFGPVDLFNELVYRSGYHYTTPTALSVDVAEGFDYTAGITYRATPDLNLFLKGENLLNKAIMSPYPTSTYVDYISPFDRTVRFGLKYVF